MEEKLMYESRKIGKTLKEIKAEVLDISKRIINLDGQFTEITKSEEFNKLSELGKIAVKDVYDYVSSNSFKSVDHYAIKATFNDKSELDQTILYLINYLGFNAKCSFSYPESGVYKAFLVVDLTNENYCQRNKGG